MEHDFEPLERHEQHVVYDGELSDENRYHISAADGGLHEGHRSGIEQVAGNGSRMYEGLHGETRKSANSVKGPRALDCSSALGLDHMDKGNTC